MQGSDPHVNDNLTESPVLEEVGELFRVTPHTSRITHMTDSERVYHDAAVAVANARVRFAQEWAMARLSSPTDKGAEMAATEATGSEIDVRLAELKILERRLMVG